MRQVVFPRTRFIPLSFWRFPQMQETQLPDLFVLLKPGQHLKEQDLFLPPTLLEEYSGFLSIYKLPRLYLQFL